MVPNFKYSEKIDNTIYLLGFLFFIFRTVFPPLKFLFLIFTLVSVVLFLKKDLTKVRLANLRHFLLPFVLVLFYIIGLIVSQSLYDLVLKEVLNIAVLAFYVVVFSVRFTAFDYRFFKWSAILLLSIGIIAIVRLILIVNGITIPFSEFLFSTQLNKLSLVSDNNYYSLYFILGIGITFFLKSKNRINALLFYSSNTVFLINIILCFSRRGYIGLLLLLLLLPLTLLGNDRKLRSTLSSFYFLVIALFIISAIFIYSFRFQIYQYDIKTSIISRNLYGLSSIYHNDESNPVFTRNLWKRVSDEFWAKYESKSDNLFYNSDFNYDLDFWSYTKSLNDSVIHDLKIENNDKYLEISRYKGDGFFQLVYHGRPIFFNKNVKYKLKFDFRVVKGEGIPFKVGWWVLDGGYSKHNLPLEITNLTDDWKNCEVIHVFKEDHIKPLGFINSLQAGTIINIRNISLTVVDSMPQFVYSDQVLEHNKSDAGSIQSNDLFGSRIDMWMYAIKMWKDEYSLKHKIFGKGFDYLPKFGKQFNNSAESYTYPHNPIISALLYSGLLGALFYIYFLVMVFLFYWKYRKDLFFACSIYVFVFTFTMFSGNSHFSVNLFAFLSFIPFIYKFYSSQLKDAQLRSL